MRLRYLQQVIAAPQQAAQAAASLQQSAVQQALSQHAAGVPQQAALALVSTAVGMVTEPTNAIALTNKVVMRSMMNSVVKSKTMNKSMQ